MNLIQLALLLYVGYLLFQGQGRLGLIAAVVLGSTLLSGVGKTVFSLGDQVLGAVRHAF